MTDWDALESPLKPVLEPTIYVEPKDKLPASEDDRQAEFVATVRRTAPACKVVGIPNGGKRTLWAAAKAKREGMHAGWPDVGVAWADRMVWIEFKNGREMPRPDQIDTLNWLHLRGHAVAVFRTSKAALDWLRQQGAPVPRAA